MDNPTPKQLDAQCRVKIDRWIDLYSNECRDMDRDHQLTVKVVQAVSGAYWVVLG